MPPDPPAGFRPGRAPPASAAPSSARSRGRPEPPPRDLLERERHGVPGPPLGGRGAVLPGHDGRQKPGRRLHPQPLARAARKGRPSGRPASATRLRPPRPPAPGAGGSHRRADPFGKAAAIDPLPRAGVEPGQVPGDGVFPLPELPGLPLPPLAGHLEAPDRPGRLATRREIVSEAEVPEPLPDEEESGPRPVGQAAECREILPPTATGLRWGFRRVPGVRKNTDQAARQCQPSDRPERLRRRGPSPEGRLPLDPGTGGTGDLRDVRDLGEGTDRLTSGVPPPGSTASTTRRTRGLTSGADFEGSELVVRKGIGFAHLNTQIPIRPQELVDESDSRTKFCG